MVVMDTAPHSVLDRVCHIDDTDRVPVMVLPPDGTWPLTDQLQSTVGVTTVVVSHWIVLPGGVAAKPTSAGQ